MHSSVELIQSRAFTDSLESYMEEARTMYPGGRFQKIFRGVHRIFRRGLVEFTDEYNAMVLVDRGQRAELAEARNTEVPVEQPVRNPFESHLTNVLPAGGIIE
jgi:hypothetical protein